MPAALRFDMDPLMNRNARDGPRHGQPALVLLHAQCRRTEILRQPPAVDINEGLNLSGGTHYPAERPVRQGTIRLLGHVAPPEQPHLDDTGELLPRLQSGREDRLEVLRQRILPPLLRNLCTERLEER